jgi:formylglycine-generating enzyme required for sulfatase activity
LNFLRVPGNQLTSLVLPAGMTNLTSIFLQGNQINELVLPSGLTNLQQLDLRTNVLTSLTIPPDMTNLTSLLLDGNPIASVVLPEVLSDSNLSTTVAALRNQGIPVFTYPLAVQITFPQQQPIGAFRFGITGPPGVYTVYSSTNLTAWQPLSFVNNPLGGIFFTDTDANLSPKKFYRAVRQIPATNMVFVPPSTFKMGSLPNDQDASADERPQTTVLLTRGYWIGKFEVTQREYLSVMNTNPSTFIGDLNRPVESVTWKDATNYCAKLTQLDLAAGRISVGSHYTLPTEAEWECAARAGTSTRFSYGDDPFYVSTISYAWFLDLGNPDLITHAVGQKLPNPSGLYDVHGNVWEWCLDDYGSYPGGTQIDPTGPVSTSLQNKVIRGGAYDYPNSSCRSASRLFRFPLMPDSDVGFRVVLVLDNQ